MHPELHCVPFDFRLAKLQPLPVQVAVEHQPVVSELGSQSCECVAAIVHVRLGAEPDAHASADGRRRGLSYVTILVGADVWLALSSSCADTPVMSQPSFHIALVLVGGPTGAEPMLSDVGTHRFGDALVSRYV